MNLHEYQKDGLEPAIVGLINKNQKIEWRYSDRFLGFLDSLPEHQRYPLIARITHEVGEDLVVLVINRDDLKKVVWHSLNDYL
jgi:hypothetical protein